MYTFIHTHECTDVKISIMRGRVRDNVTRDNDIVIVHLTKNRYRDSSLIPKLHRSNFDFHTYVRTDSHRHAQFGAK